MVLQDSFLFDGSIRENIRFSRPAASDEEILEAARIGQLTNSPCASRMDMRPSLGNVMNYRVDNGNVFQLPEPSWQIRAF